MVFKILCFGNSLTAGYWNWGCTYHPYAEKLEEQLLSSELPIIHQGVEIDVDGMPGDLAISPPGKFLDRMVARCSKTSYDWVIVLGGTNDLANPGFSSAQIFGALEKSYSVALNSKGKNRTKVLALTIPESRHKIGWVTSRRDEINAMILAYSTERFYAFDLHSALPYHSMPPEQRAKIWDDGLHLKDEGYDMMGELIADHLIALLSAQPGGPDQEGKVATSHACF